MGKRRWFLVGFNILISLTHTHWNSFQLGKPRFENPLYLSVKSDIKPSQTLRTHMLNAYLLRSLAV
jgi:hypothetical protein